MTTCSLPGPSADLRLTTTHPAPTVAVVAAAGEIDMASAPAWASAATVACDDLAASSPPDPRAGDDPAGPAPPAATGEVGPARLVCDLRGVGFFGAAGVTVLVELAWRAAHAGVQLQVVADTRAVRRVLEITGVDQQLWVQGCLGPAVDDAVPVQRASLAR